MAAPMQALTEPLLNKSFADCSPGELRQLTEQYPYFAPAHFLLLKKLDPASEEYRIQYQKAILYFHDPLSFELLLNRELVPGTTAPEPDAPSGIAAAEPEVTQPEPAGITAEEGALPVSSEEHEGAEPVALEMPEIPEPDAQVAPPLLSDELTEGRDEIADEEVAAPPPADEPASLPSFSIDLSAPPKGDLSFEPFHTVDYFASQGIKLTAAEEVPRDKFGKQLKSFTDWLKTMKRLPEAATPDPLDTKTDEKVDHLADDSVQQADIVTESMAEVWLKQGNKRKAAQIYRKLSLLHPAKSAYFADKINSLND
ncbi:hypothetical protein [Flaviaesturariibacter amylovorans]|uniref:Tetratricopeptide repeat protein n=1 Tax=Flaviaesturariibacter amylovorans TaxID=1084520 RepID=A0ABP8GSI2_9BACT